VGNKIAVKKQQPDGAGRNEQKGFPPTQWADIQTEKTKEATPKKGGGEKKEGIIVQAGVKPWTT